MFCRTVVEYLKSHSSESQKSTVEGLILSIPKNQREKYQMRSFPCRIEALTFATHILLVLEPVALELLLDAL